ncbi:MAG TPA: serine/threonine-protein kinase, partial [Kofleriaceae bacterium]|nr:serine/threonine-protein kinase [Kofleriaceae bacterium]
MPSRLLSRSPSALPRTLSAPTRRGAADRFELHEKLGSGSTGTVWRAWDRQRSAEVALKILHQLDTSVVRRFKHEFRTLANLRHRHVVRFHELFEVDDQLFFSMEFIDGVEFLSWIWGFDEAPTMVDGGGEFAFDADTKPNALQVAGPQVDYQRLRAVFAQLTEGLTHVHSAGYLHRDLKPSNLIVDRDGHLRILDFGLSASLLAPHVHELATAVGTIAYMAPEVAELRPADERADYYGVGVLLFEALTGRTPFPGDQIAQVLAAKATEDAPAPSTLMPGVPADLDRLCQLLLARDPSRRAGADELRRVFQVARRPSLRATEPPDHLARGSGSIAPPPVVGRNREMDQLTSDLGRACTAGFQCRLVVGSSGVGKSALADAFARRTSQNAVVLMGRCHDRETIPFRAVDELIDSLSHHISTLTPADRRALAASVATPLGSLLELFPVLRCLASDEPPVRGLLDPGTMRRQAFAALRELLTVMARTAPLALVIDDLHLADPDSLDLLGQVFRGQAAPPVLVVGLGRPGSVMDQLCAQSAKDGGPSHKVELAPLQGDEAELAARALASYMDVTLTDARSIAIDTGGHPGFMFEILRRAPTAEPQGAGYANGYANGSADGRG